MAALLNVLSTGCREEIWVVYAGAGPNQDILKVYITFGEFTELSLFLRWHLLKYLTLLWHYTSQRKAGTYRLRV